MSKLKDKTMTKYITERGLTTKLVAQKAGVTRQAIQQYGTKFTPTARTLEKLAKAMTELGAETKVLDLVRVLYDKE